MMNFKEHIFMNLSLHHDRSLLCIMILSTIGTGLIPAITSILTGKVFDLLSQISPDHSIPYELTVKSMSLMALGAASFPAMWALISSWMFIGERQGFRIRNNMLQSYLNKSFQWYDTNNELLGNFTQLNRCVEEVRQSSSEAAAIIFQSVVTVCALIGTSFYYSWSLTLIILCSAPLIMIIAFILSKLINKYVNLENQETTKAANVLVWSMNVDRMIKINNAQDLEINKFNKLVDNCNYLFIKVCLFTSLNYSLIRFLTLCMFVQGFWFGSTMIRRGKLNINDVITCFHSCLMLGSTLSEVLHQIIILQKGDVANKKLNTFLTEKDDTVLQSENNMTIVLPKKQILDKSLTISFHNIFFKYPNRPQVSILNDVSATFPGKEMTFIVGRSGSGKSTLSKLLLKFYENYEGDIKINDMSIKSIHQQWIINNTTVVEQRCKLFNDTLRNNILLGHPEFGEKDASSFDIEVKAACRFALLDKVIEELPNGLDTQIGSEGVTLSGGQSQRVALARAFLRDTPILILDEAVSSLDIINRQLLMNSIRSWRLGKTTIVLTHELDQIQANELLYVVENGTIVESGYQHKLLEIPGSKFKKLYETQQSNRSTDDPNNSIIDEYSDDNISEKSISSDSQTSINDKDGKLVEWSNVSTSTDEYTMKDKFSGEPSESKPQGEMKDSKQRDLRPKKDLEGMTLLEITKHMLNDLDKKSILVIGVIFSLLAGAANPIFSFAFSYLLNGIVPNENNGSSSSYLIKWSFIVLGIAVADGIFNFFKSFLLGYCSEIWILRLRQRAMEVIQYNKHAWFNKEENQPAELSAVLLNDLRDLRNLISEFLSTASTFLVVLLCGLIWALVSGWKLSLVSISMFPLIIVFSGIYGYLLQQYETDYKSEVANLENCLFEIMTGIKTIKYLQLQEHFIKKHSILKSNIEKVARKRAFVTGVGISFTHTLTLCIQAILYYYGLKLVFIGEYSSKKMFETFTLLLFTIMTCTNLVNQIPEVARGQRAAIWTYRIIDQYRQTREDVCGHGRSLTISKDQMNKNLVRIQNLTFSYPGSGNKQVYKNMNLVLGSTQTVAIVGESGAGKSTLIALLTRLYDPNKNSVFIDGTDVLEWNLASLRDQIAVVDQTPVIFNSSIRENLKYGLTQDISESEMVTALKAVDMYDFILTLPDGLDYQIDTELLSGGQLQRLCIARALLTNKRILILDECTSALDAESSKIIHDIVATGIRTTLAIAITHDKQMMKACQDIVVFGNGTVVQQGKYDDLIASSGEFKRIVDKIY
ncbi:alpha-factor-transporting ATPase [Monosporozyma servazzii]